MRAHFMLADPEYSDKDVEAPLVAFLMHAGSHIQVNRLILCTTGSQQQELGAAVASTPREPPGDGATRCKVYRGAAAHGGARARRAESKAS